MPWRRKSYRKKPRIFDSEVLRRASGDIFGRIYEYFLAKFSIEKAHDICISFKS